jgi:TolB protein
MKYFIFLLGLLPAFLISQTDYPEERIITHPANDRYASYSPAGDRILFESDRSGNWDIYLWGVKTGETTKLFDDTVSRRRPAWSPNGQRIIFEAYQEEHENSLIEYDLLSKSARTLVAAAAIEGEILFAHYAPDGEQIVFTLMESSLVSNICLLNTDTGNWTKITDFSFRTTYANWAPNGKSLVLFSRKETNNQDDEIYLFQLKTAKWTRLTDWPKHNFCPSFSPSGRQIAYVTSMEDTRPEIYLMDKKGKKQTRITFNEDGDTLPRWSPDGKRLLITAYRGDNYEICEIRVVY